MVFLYEVLTFLFIEKLPICRKRWFVNEGLSIMANHREVRTLLTAVAINDETFMMEHL